MKRITKILFIGVFSPFITATQACSQTTGATPDVYVAITPCSSGTRPLPGIPAESECELIKWELKLFAGKEKQIPATYILDCSYGLPGQGTKGLLHGGKHLHREGKWDTVKNAGKNSSAVIYRLDPENPKTSVLFLRLNENLIHLLDSHQQLMIGDGGSSYTLNRLQQ